MPLLDYLCDSKRRKVSFSPPEIMSQYLYTNTQFRENASFWTILLQAAYAGKYSHLVKITTPDHTSIDAIKAYGRCIWAMRENLRKISIFDWPQVDGKYTFNNLQLDKFPRLQGIRVDIKTSDSVLELTSIIKNNRYLEDMFINSVNGGHRLSTFEPNQRGNMQSSYSPCPSVESITCCGHLFLTEKIIRHFIHAYPNLNNLHLNPSDETDVINDSSDSDYFTTGTPVLTIMTMEGVRVPNQLWIEFLIYLFNKVPLFQVSHIFSNDVDDVLAGFMDVVDFGFRKTQ